MPRRAPTSGPLFVSLLALLVAGDALAAPAWQVFGTAAVGWTDNVLNAPNQPLPGQRGRESDFFFQLSPGAALTTGSPRFIQRLSYTFTADLFTTHPDGDSYSNSLNWAGLADPSRTTHLLVVAQSQQGRISTFNLQLPAAAGQATVLANGTAVNFFSQFVSETLTWDITPKWRAWESAAFRAFIPIDRGQLADTYTASGELGSERLFTVDGVGLVARTEYINYRSPRGPKGMITLPDQEQLLTSLVARWRRDWSTSWSSEVNLGLVEAEPLHLPGAKRVWQPTGMLALRYTRDTASAELRYAHDVLANPLAGSSFLYDNVSLRGTVPLPAKWRLFLGATATYQHAQALSLTGGLSDTHAHVVLLDCSLTWQALPELGVFARYSFFDQLAHNAPLSPMGPAATTLPDLMRNTVLLGVSVSYPATMAVRVPTRSATRVDRSDEPGIPADHAPLPR